jgi:NitT/TauT family transport system ATP-binding protein
VTPDRGASSEIRIRDVTMIYGTADHEVAALDAISLDVAPGELVCLLGPSGCGKSTLLNIIAGFLAPSRGEVIAGGTRVTQPGPDRGMVFQVRANVAFGLEMRCEPKEKIAETVDALLAKLHLTEFAGRFPKDLSGGMRQRVAIARVLALDSPILLMDEPFGALDALTRRNLQDELLRIWTELRKTIVFVTHGIDESLYLADRIVVMTFRPGHVKAIVPVSLNRPRDVSSPEFNELKRSISAMVMEEQKRHEQEESRSIPSDAAARE